MEISPVIVLVLVVTQKMGRLLSVTMHATLTRPVPRRKELFLTILVTARASAPLTMRKHAKRTVRRTEMGTISTVLHQLKSRVVKR